MKETEEMENEELEETEEETEEETSPKKESKIELDFSMDAIERINIEAESAKDGLRKIVGGYLAEKMAKDEPLKQAYKDRKITLKAVCDFITECAKKKLGGTTGAVESDEVFGWAIHYVQDEPVKVSESNSYTLTKEEKESARAKAIREYEAAERKKLEDKAKKEAERKQAKIRKAEEEREKSGQMSLFDDMSLFGL